jgi:ferredoxin
MPRTQDPLPIIDPIACTGCGLCIDLCPTNALDQVDGRSSLVAPDACTYCMVCQDVCPEDAITLPFLIVFGNESD